jgi:ubiquinone/menaquinone biosynthesis C-methylase UbiE
MTTPGTLTPSKGQELPPDALLMQIGFGPLMAQALYVAAKLGIPDLIAEKPLHVSELSRATDTHERSLYRVMRSLSSIGIFKETDPKVFALTPHSELLRSDHPNSLRNGMIFLGEEWHFRVWGDTLYSVKTGKPAWGKTHGEEVFDYFERNREAGEIFNRAMTDISRSTAPAVVEAYDFSGIETLADIAGGHGLLLATIIKANPQMKGILFDVPSVIEGAHQMLKQEGVSDRIQTTSGDFFKAVPEADCYIMKHIIHDWDDEKSLKILQNINRAMKGKGRVLLVEVVVPIGNEPHYSKLMDLEMLTSPGGIERTEEEYRELFAGAGFRLTRIVPTKSPYSVIEAVKE